MVAELATSLAVGDALPAAEFRQVWLDTVFECFKLDPQFGDTATLAPWPLVMKADEWAALARTAERLAAETLAAELELPHRPELLRELALPRPCRNAIREAARSGAPPAIARVMRFDFHPTAQGWQVSEVNCDVPGGFIEASGFTAMMAARYPGLRPSGDPTAALANALATAGPVGLVHATGYLDDRQVMHFLQRALTTRGAEALLLGPDEVAWKDGFASAAGVALGAIFRFFPGEWLPNLGRRSGWQHYFRGSKTPQCNPATTLAAQSKRLPLVWDRLAGSFETWKSVLPETRAARGVAPDATWVLKAALGRVGEEVGIMGVTAEKELRKIERWARRRPRRWIAQRRFEALALPVGGGSIYPCIGIYTVDGKACGAYGRAAARALVDGNSRDVAVLLED
ncbi:MAG: glutathionylspermidine synthase family protein [Planctomycetes bacterium]|nr:glutathionylspermidine synthase family protein [Planctomycetota bacterium]